MRLRLLLGSVALSTLAGCAVVGATVAVTGAAITVGAAAVSTAATVGAAAVKGTVKAGEAVADAVSSPDEDDAAEAAAQAPDAPTN